MRDLLLSFLDPSPTQRPSLQKVLERQDLFPVAIVDPASVAKAMSASRPLSQEILQMLYQTAKNSGFSSKNRNPQVSFASLLVAVTAATPVPTKHSLLALANVATINALRLSTSRITDKSWPCWSPDPSLLVAVIPAS